MFLFKNHSENEAGKLVQDHFLFFLKNFILCKSKWSAAWFHYILIALKLAYSRSRVFKTLHYWSRDMLDIDFLDKGLGIVSLAHFVYDFSAKIFFMLYSINWPNFIAWLPSFLRYWVICVSQLFVTQVVMSWILKLTLAF